MDALCASSIWTQWTLGRGHLMHRQCIIGNGTASPMLTHEQKTRYLYRMRAPPSDVVFAFSKKISPQECGLR